MKLFVEIVDGASSKGTMVGVSDIAAVMPENAEIILCNNVRIFGRPGPMFVAEVDEHGEFTFTPAKEAKTLDNATQRIVALIDRLNAGNVPLSAVRDAVAFVDRLAEDGGEASAVE